MPASPVIITLPWPPSDNRLTQHATVGRGASAHSIAYPSAAAKDYQREVHALLLAKRLPRIAGRLRVDVELYPPDRRSIDPANRLKALLDSIKRRELGRRKKGSPPRWDPKQLAWLFATDDSQAVEGSWKLRHVVDGGKAVVTLTPLPDAVQAELFGDDECPEPK